MPRSNNIEIRKATFIKNANLKYDNKFDYSLVNFKTAKIPVDIICPDHGIFTQTPTHHLRYIFGCPKCAIDDKNKKSRIIEKDIFINNANLKHNNKFDYSLVDYQHYKTKVKIICPEHGVFEQSPTNHLNAEYPCPSCYDFSFIEIHKETDHKNETEKQKFIENAEVTDFKVFEKTHETYENIPPELIDRLYKGDGTIPVDELEFASDIEPQECFILKSVRSSVLARYIPQTGMIKRIEKERSFGIEPRNAEQAFAMNVLLDDDVKLVALTGKSGTGKTLLAFAAALQRNDSYKQILLARPIVALSNKDLGFLPGDEKQKIAPYMQPLFDNLNVIKHNFSYQGKEIRQIDEMQKNNQLVIEALAYIRGRSLSDTFFIVDEAQNLTPHEIKTIITRAGEGTKIVFTGDIQQIDSPYLDMFSNGLVYMIDRMRGQALFAHINLVKGERSSLSELASDLL